MLDFLGLPPNDLDGTLTLPHGTLTLPHGTTLNVTVENSRR